MKFSCNQSYILIPISFIILKLDEHTTVALTITIQNLILTLIILDNISIIKTTIKCFSNKMN